MRDFVEPLKNKKNVLETFTGTESPMEIGISGQSEKSIAIPFDVCCGVRVLEKSCSEIKDNNVRLLKAYSHGNTLQRLITQENLSSGQDLRKQSQWKLIF